MSSRIVEFFGTEPLSSKSVANAQAHHCPFVDAACIKNESKSLGACSLQIGDNAPVIICPNRLYAKNFKVLDDIASLVFGPGHELVSALTNEKRRREGSQTGQEVIVFGKYFGKELGIPKPAGQEEGDEKGNFYIDYLLTKVDENGQLLGFAAVEVQTIDTTNSYRDVAAKFKQGSPAPGQTGNNVPDTTNAGLNWENVSKRILPQIIYKGHALRKEHLCHKGLFFVLPHAVFQRIKRRLGGKLQEYPMAGGSVTFRTYDLGPVGADGERQLVFRETLTTTVEQIAFAFVSPQNLSEAGVYEKVIATALGKFKKMKKLSSP